jgi:TRAP-type uncharacterized transport system substrate-binding protein
MSIETYGLSSEQYAEFFENNLRTAVALYLQTFNALASANVDFKTIFRLYQETVYVTNDDCRRYQKANNPEAIKDNDLFGLTPSREELMEEIQSVNAKVDALVDYLSRLVETTTDGLNGLVKVMDKD